MCIIPDNDRSITLCSRYEIITLIIFNAFTAYRGEMKDDVHGSRTGDVTTTVSGRSSSVENGYTFSQTFLILSITYFRRYPKVLTFCASLGSVRHVGRRGAVHIMKDDGSLNPNEGKPSKRGVAGGHEVWFCI